MNYISRWRIEKEQEKRDKWMLVVGIIMFLITTLKI